MIAGGARARVDVDRTVTPGRPDALRRTEGGLFSGLEPMLFLVDGNNLLWRAAHAPAAPFPADDGRDITPLFRFFTLLRRALGTYGLFAECIVCFDGASGWSSRLLVDENYKANREYESKDLSFMQWLPEIRAALECAGAACVEDESSEADDVIATLAALAGTRPVRILSSDRDYFQLVSPSVTLINPKTRPPLIDMQAVASFGVTPQQWCDFRALSGDVSDGIRGVRGIGPKSAAQLLAGGRRLEDVRPHVADQWDDVVRWRELIRLRTDVELWHRPTGESTPPLPSPVVVCRELGLIR